MFFHEMDLQRGGNQGTKGARQDKMMAFVNWMTFAAARP
jgi:hypothetical protein